MGKGLIPIMLKIDIDRCENFERLDTHQIVSRQDVRVLLELPCLFIKPHDTAPQIGAFAHYSSADFNEMPEEANAVLLSSPRRAIKHGGMEVYAGVYCHLT